jgi:hypothetical protein
VTVLTPPLFVAALVLGAAGVAKLRAPRGAALAARTLGLPVGPAAVRGLAVVEIAVGLAVVLTPASLVATVLLACLYAGFAALSLLLARRRASCGCFGERDVPASAIGSLLSLVLAGVAIAASSWPAHSLGWIVGRSPGVATITLIGIAGAAYATIVAYTDLPVAWTAWSAR